MRTIILFISILLLTISASATDSVTINFENGDAVFTANISEIKGEEGHLRFSVNDLKISIPGENPGKLHLVSEFGWGDQPYNFLCEQISQKSLTLLI